MMMEMIPEPVQLCETCRAAYRKRGHRLRRVDHFRWPPKNTVCEECGQKKSIRVYRVDDEWTESRGRGAP